MLKIGISLISAYILVYANNISLKSLTIKNPTAYISAQCYTNTENTMNKSILHNPCYTCHTVNKKPNFTLSDQYLQTAYDFPEAALKNPWTNLFKDRTVEVSKISDNEIINYIRQDNYKKDGKIILAQKLQKDLPSDWDYNNNGKWDGYIPDVNFNFDKEGFDKDNSGNYTGWRAFGYNPFPSTFWPTNGSTDDVLIRLAKPFQENEKGEFDLDTYKINLAIVESLIKQKTIDINPSNENKYGVDLNQNGKLDIAKQIVFKWLKPTYNLKTRKIADFSMSYVGRAKNLLISNELLIAPGLYPLYTEFVHTVRYIDFDNNGQMKMSNRIKEFRYAGKLSWNTYSQLANAGLSEIKEKDAFPDRHEVYPGEIEKGISNQRGWLYHGFIEDKNGDLRPQTHEENLFCMGCHSNLGVLADSTFVFQRKHEKGNFQDGWYHWSQKGIQGIADIVLKNGEGEYERYLKINNAGDEFRANNEVMDKFFVKGWQKDIQNIEKDLITKLENPNANLKQTWKLKSEAMDKLKNDISYLLVPSQKRAMELNKAYKVIVDEQSYTLGREAHIKPFVHIEKEVTKGQSTHLEIQRHD